MAYDEYQVERISRFFSERKVEFVTKKMMGGLCFMIDEKMACGTHVDKKEGIDLLMVRIGEDAYGKNKDKKGCRPMNFTGRPMKGYAFIDGNGIDTDKDLNFWLQLCLDFNPLAKKSKKKKKK